MHSAKFVRRLFSITASVAALAASAATYHIDPVKGSTAGDGSAAAPWSTLEWVMTAKKSWRAGDVLVLHAGDHGRPSISGIIEGGEVTVRAEAGQEPRAANLSFRGATHWNVSGLTVSPEGAPAVTTQRRSGVLVSIGSDCRDITVHHCQVFSARDIAGWSEADWLARAVDGINNSGVHCTIADNTLRNVRFGIQILRDGRDSTVARNLVDNFMNDGLRGLADHCLFEGNTVRNCYRIDGNHDDGFQSWTGGANGVPVGGGVVRGVVLRGNTFISYTDPAQPFKAAMQGIGCFDGTFEDWVVENNLVVTDMWHGIAFYGAKNCRIVNNTVAKNPIDAAARTPWIQISPHKNGTPSASNLVRNNLTPTLHVPASVAIVDHNLVSHDTAALFVDFRHFNLHLKSGSPAIDAGATDRAPSIDLDGRTRTTPIDIGAFELAPNPRTASAR